MTRNKEKYRNLCNYETSIPLFMRDWWLDSVCGDSWDVFIIEENNKIVATLSYYIHKKYFFKSIIPPHITPIGGLWISYQEGIKISTRYSHEIKVMNYFAKEIDKLKLDYYSQKFHHSIDNWLGFYWNGYKQTTNYTYRISTLDNMEETFSNLDSPIKKRINNITDNFIISNDINERDFYKINSLTYKRQGIKCPFPFEVFHNIENASKKRNASKMFCISDKQGNIHSVSYVVFDNDICYGLFSGTNPEYRKSHSSTILLWEILKYASNIGCKEYDYTGSMIKQVETFIRHFGAIQTPYFLVEKEYSKLYSILRNFKK